jgi:alpha-1,3-glucosyltransferase
MASASQQQQHHLDKNDVTIPNLPLLLCAITSLFRVLIAFHPHSGQDNHHGARKAYGGDFEAQRHWMELTYHLDIGEWYYYDLQYWGLDYPPLTAYVSWLCGWFSHHLVGPESVALMSSRGIEDPTHKAFMRATVFVLDWLVFGSAVWYAAYRRNNFHHRNKSLWTIFLTLSQPAILLIDHGHFQYNTVGLGLAVGSFAYMVQSDFSSCIVSAVLFSLALNFKQMTLYYAPAVFCYLLGRCLEQPKLFVQRFFQLGAAVIVTFSVMWAPFVMHGPPDTTPTSRILHVLRRIFPFERGLFEGKVANLWCALSTKPIQIRERLPAGIQPMFALGLTLAMMMPACYAMLQLGRRNRRTTTSPDNNNNDDNTHWHSLLWATTSCALSFFLASFQVHEKSILLALAPCSLLLWQDAAFVDWFSIACAWTLWPLLQVDRLHSAYACMIVIFACLIWMRRQQEAPVSASVFSGTFLSSIPILTILGMLGLHALEIVVEIPPHLPDLFELLWSLAGCGMFCVAWFVTCWKLLMTEPGHYSKAKTA